MKYKIGDKVRVRPDLHTGMKTPHDDGFWYMDDMSHKHTVIDQMVQLAGELVIITIVDSEGYRIDKNKGCQWTDEMFVEPSHTTMKKVKVNLGKWNL